MEFAITRQGVDFELILNGEHYITSCGRYTIIDNSPRGWKAIGPMGTHICVGNLDKCVDEVASIINRENKCI